MEQQRTLQQRRNKNNNNNCRIQISNGTTWHSKLLKRKQEAILQLPLDKQQIKQQL